MGGLEMMRKYGPDDGSPDAYIEYAEFIDGTELTSEQLDELMDEYPDLTYEKAVEQMYQQEGLAQEGSCGYNQTPDGIKLDTPGSTRGMDANKRTMTMIPKSKQAAYLREIIKKEIKKLNENK